MSGFDKAIQATESRIRWLNISIDNSLLYGLDNDCPPATVTHVVSGVNAMQSELTKLESELQLMRKLRK